MASQPEALEIMPPKGAQYVVVGDGQFVDHKPLPDGTLVTVKDENAAAFEASGLSVKKVTGEWTPPEPPSSE